MPKRSNDFQKLVYLLKKHMSDNAPVTESRFLKDRITGAKREVDVCIETCIGGHGVIVSIEVINHKRKADVTWIEKMKGKHERLPTSTLVLYSKSGFTEEANNVAKSYGIETLSLEKIDNENVKALFSRVSCLYGKNVTLSPRKVTVRVKQTGDLQPENVVALPDNNVYSFEYEYLCLLQELVDKWLKTKEVFEKFAIEGQEEHIAFHLIADPARDDRGRKLYLHKEDPKVFREIEWVKIEGDSMFEVSEFPLEQGLLSGVKVAWGSGDFEGKPALLVASEDGNGLTKISIEFRG